MIAKLRYFVPSTVLVNIYNSLILPYITYGLLASGNASNAYLNKILVLQKRVLRLIYFTDQREHAIPLFAKAKILPVTFLNHKNYNFLDCDWFKKLLFPTNSLVKLLSDSLLSDTLLSDSSLSDSSISQSHSEFS